MAFIRSSVAFLRMAFEVLASSRISSTISATIWFASSMALVVSPMAYFCSDVLMPICLARSMFLVICSMMTLM